MKLSEKEILAFARKGAAARLVEIREEADRIYRRYPDLDPRLMNLKPAPKKHRLSDAGRKKIVTAARKRWAEWRKKNKK